MRKRLILWSGLALLLLAAVLAANTFRNAAGWQPVTDSPTERLALLRPHWRLVLPDAGRFAAPHPAAILLSGCDGVHDNMDYWAERMAAHGRAALILDSHRPRNLDQHQAWRAVCAAQILTGAERAGDLAVALAALEEMEGIDAGDVALFGASHGGWTAMELIQLATRDALPPGLSAWPAPPGDLLDRIGPVILLYPYCGILSRAEEGHWPAHLGGLMILAENDSITDPEKCREMAADLVLGGAAIEVATIRGADHGFDQRDRSSLSILEFDPARRAEATEHFDSFMQGFAFPRAAGL